MEVGGVGRDVRERVVDLVVEAHLLLADVLHRHARATPERHEPVAVERAAGIHADGKRGDLRVLVVGAREEVAHGALHRRRGLVVPVHADNGMPPELRGRHPDVLDRAGPLDVRKRQRLTGRNLDERVHLPALAELAGAARRVGDVALVLVRDRIGQRAGVARAGEVLGADRARACIGEAAERRHVGRQAVERSGHAAGGQRDADRKY